MKNKYQLEQNIDFLSSQEVYRKNQNRETYETCPLLTDYTETHKHNP